MSTNGGLLQLVAKGSEDKFLSENESVNKFTHSISKHSNYARQPIKRQFTSQSKNGSVASVIVPRVSDMLHKVYLHCTVEWECSNDADKIDWTKIDKKVNYETFFKEASFSVNGQTLQTIYGDTSAVFDKFHGSFLNFNTSLIPDKTFSNGGTSNSVTLSCYIPINFWFTSSLSQSFPLIALVHQQVKIDVEIASKKPWIVPTTTGTTTLIPTITKSDIIFDMIYLDTEQRKLIATAPEHKMLIHQYQRNSASIVGTATRTPLFFKHPVTALLWRLLNENNESQEILNCRLEANGIDFTESLDSAYFKYIQNYQSFNNKDIAKLGFHIQSFSTSPLGSQPKGSINFSRLDKVIIHTNTLSTISGSRLDIIAISYNIVLLKNGMCGLLWH